MSRKSYANALDEALRPLGFYRKGDDWTRVRSGMWECVNRQSSRLGSGVTVNLYIKDAETEKLYLEIFAPTGAIQMPPKDTRIGALIDKSDRWWKTDEPNGPEEMAQAVIRYGLPWFDKVRTLEEQAVNWYARNAPLTSRGDPKTMVGLALTLYRMGEIREACEVLRKPVPRTAFQSWIEEIARVREWMSCDSLFPPGPG